MRKIITLCIIAMTISVYGQNEKKANWKNMGGNKDVSFYEIKTDFQDFWKTNTPKKGQGYSVFKRWEAYMAPRVFPSGDMSLPSTTYENYMKWLDSSEGSQLNSAPGDWTSLGPLTVPSGYDSGAGRVDFVRFDPNNNNIMYVGAPDGGLWKSTNGGVEWTTNTDFLGVIGVSDLVINPNNTQIMYLATGNWEYDRRSIGVLKSTNGGDDWVPTSLTWTATDNYKIRRLLMHPSNPLIMMVATDGGVFRTDDGWMTHTNVYCCNSLYDMKFKPGDPNTVYAAGFDFLKSTDNGVNWTLITSVLPSSNDISRTMLAVTAHDPNYVYAVMGNNDGGYLGLYRSTDSGNNFSLRSSSPNILQSSKDGSGTGGQATHDLAINVAPDDKNWVTVGGINQWRSPDGGATWSILSYWLGNDDNYPGEGDATPDYTHADIQDIQYEPGSAIIMYTTADGGVYKSTNDGYNWTQITNNLSIAQQTNIAQSATTEGLIVAGLQDIGTIKRDGGTGVWSVINGGDGESAFIDYTNDLNIVTSNPNGAHDLSTDGGLTRNAIGGGLPAGNLFFSQISQDPVTPTTVYAGGRLALWKSTDFTSTWAVTGATPPGTGESPLSVIRFAVAPSNPSTIVVIKGNEYDPVTLSKSTDGGATWDDITGTLPVADAQMSAVTFSNTDADKMWVTFSGYSSGNKVFKSSDGGATWENMSMGLPNLPINTIVYVNDNPKDALFIGGDIGVYYYNNTFETARTPGSWTLYNSDLPNARVSDIKIFYPTMKLRVATYGRGTWEADLPAALPVELVNFSGENKKDENLLIWSTASESNLDHYSVERSSDGKNYQSIGKVNPSSTSSSTLKEYNYTDRSLISLINYYRLKVVDIDGSYEYSKAIVLYQETLENSIRLFPNPTKNILEIKGENLENSTIRIIDSFGRLISSMKLSENGQLNVSEFPNGAYYLEIKLISNKTIVKKFIKQ